MKTIETNGPALGFLRCALPAVGAALLLGACFVDPKNSQVAEPPAKSISIDPPSAVLRPGWSRKFTATYTGELTDPELIWVTDAALETAFVVINDPNLPEMQLVSNLNLPGNYSLGVQLVGDPEVSDFANIRAEALNFGNPPPPIQLGGVDAHDTASGVAAGGDVYHVAYANYGDFLTIGTTGSINSFVKRFDLETGEELSDLPANTFFQDPGLRPNIASDCNGNAYWVDRGIEFSTLIYRFPREETSNTSSITLPPNIIFEYGLAVGAHGDCNGTAYFIGFDSNTGAPESLLGFQPEVFFVSDFDAGGQIDRFDDFGQDAWAVEFIAVDSEGRVLLAAPYVDGNRSILRLLPELATDGIDGNEIDPEFIDPEISGIRGIAVDGQGAIYVFTTQFSEIPEDDRSTIHVLNEFGAVIDTITTYDYFPECCGGVDGCGDLAAASPFFGEDVPFQRIVTMTGSEFGKLRVVDDLTLGTLPVEFETCQEASRIILIDPASAAAE